MGLCQSRMCVRNPPVELDLPEEVNEPWSYFARLSRAYEERFANVQKEAVMCPLALDGMQHSSHGTSTASDQVSVISV